MINYQFIFYFDTYERKSDWNNFENRYFDKFLKDNLCSHSEVRPLSRRIDGSFWARLFSSKTVFMPEEGDCMLASLG